MNEGSISFIICWSGDYPWYFPNFLHYFRYNPTIVFLIFTDNNSKLNLSPNMKIIPYSLEQFNVEASKALSFEVAIESEFNLCAFKSAYEAIFSDW